MADSQGTDGTPRRFRAALEHALADWAAADPARCAAQAGCGLAPGGVAVPFFGRSYTVTHPQGEATAEGSGKPAHVAVTIALLHYLLRADGTPPAGRWIAFRELPDGLFYSASFATRAEEPLARAFGGLTPGGPTGPATDSAQAGPAASGAEPGLAAFRRVAEATGGSSLQLGDASYAFAALPRLPVAVVLWAGDEEFAARASLLFDESAGHYLPTEDLAGLGESLVRSLLGGLTRAST